MLIILCILSIWLRICGSLHFSEFLCLSNAYYYTGVFIVPQSFPLGPFKLPNPCHISPPSSSCEEGTDSRSLHNPTSVYSTPQPKLQYSSHLMQRANSLEKTLMLGKIEHKRRRGMQRVRWLHSTPNSMDMNLSKLQETVKDREARHASMGLQRVGHDLATEQQLLFEDPSHPTTGFSNLGYSQDSKFHSLS